MPKGLTLTEAELSQRRREIFDAAVNLFLEKGFQETSMREIAEAAGMGKSSLYDYFRTKDEILAFVIEEETIILIKQAQAIASQNTPPEIRLKQIMRLHVSFMQENANLFSRLSAEALRLKPESQKGIQQTRYAYQDLVAGIIQEGIAGGRFREVNPLHAARLLLNSLLSVLYTTRPTGSAEAMLEEAVEIFLHGLNI
jgi:AcrR family transcriptional regulator